MRAGMRAVVAATQAVVPHIAIQVRKSYGMAGDAASAVAITDVVDLLLVDFVLPDLNGRDLTARLRERQPGLPVILMSGYLPDPELAPSAPFMFMQKPMRPAAILEMVDRMLAGA